MPSALSGSHVRPIPTAETRHNISCVPLWNQGGNERPREISATAFWTRQLQIHEALCKIHDSRSKVGCVPPHSTSLPDSHPLFSPAENGFSESFEKVSTVQLTCSEGALFQYMVMRNVQLTGLHQEEAHNKGLLMAAAAVMG